MANESEYKRTMSDDERETPDVHNVNNPEVTHEKNDVNVFAIARFVGGLAIATFVVFGLMFGMLKALEAVVQFQEEPASPLARTEQERLPPNPRLQGATGHSFEPDDITGDPAMRQQLAQGEMQGELDFELDEPMREWDVLRQYQLEELHTYGRDVRRPGEFRIPVDRAKELLLERNQLTSRPQPQQQPGVNFGEGTVTPAAPDNELERMRQMEGYDALPTYQSSGQKVERRRQ